MFSNERTFGSKDDVRAEPRSPASSVFGARTTVQPQGSSHADADKAAGTSPEHQGSKLVVGPNIRMKAVEVTDCDVLVIEGTIDASLDSRLVQIAESGVFTGHASMDVAEIRGRFEGELTVRSQLVIYPTGRVCGHIRYGKIRIEEGGQISGEISTLPSGGATDSAGATVELKTVKTIVGSPKYEGKTGSAA